MKRCDNCGLEFEDNIKFCTNCGGQLHSVDYEPKIKYCSQCGSQISDDMKFCTMCGLELTPVTPVDDTTPKEKKTKAAPQKKVIMICVICFVLLAGIVGIVYGVRNFAKSKSTDSEETQASVVNTEKTSENDETTNIVEEATEVQERETVVNTAKQIKSAVETSLGTAEAYDEVFNDGVAGNYIEVSEKSVANLPNKFKELFSEYMYNEFPNVEEPNNGYTKYAFLIKEGEADVEFGEGIYVYITNGSDYICVVPTEDEIAKETEEETEEDIADDTEVEITEENDNETEGEIEETEKEEWEIILDMYSEGNVVVDGQRVCDGRYYLTNEGYPIIESFIFDETGEKCIAKVFIIIAPSEEKAKEYNEADGGFWTVADNMLWNFIEGDNNVCYYSTEEECIQSFESEGANVIYK